MKRIGRLKANALRNQEEARWREKSWRTMNWLPLRLQGEDYQAAQSAIEKLAEQDRVDSLWGTF